MKDQTSARERVWYTGWPKIGTIFVRLNFAKY